MKKRLTFALSLLMVLTCAFTLSVALPGGAAKATPANSGEIQSLVIGWPGGTTRTLVSSGLLNELTPAEIAALAADGWVISTSELGVGFKKNFLPDYAYDIEYEHNTNTLTLNGYSGTAGGEIVCTGGTLNIVINDGATCEAAGIAMNKQAATGGNLQITGGTAGTGVLDITSSTADALDVDGGLTVQKCKVNAVSTSASGSGVSADSINANTGGSIIGTGHGTDNTTGGVYSADAVSASTGGTITGTGYYGVYAGTGRITADGGTIEGYGTSIDGGGITTARGKVIVNSGGSILGTRADSLEDSSSNPLYPRYGITAGGSIEVSGENSTLTGEGQTGAEVRLMATQIA